jgi:hypothetical protein
MFGTDTGNRSYVYPRYTDNLAYMKLLNNVGTYITPSVTDGRGFFSSARTAAGTETHYINAVSQGSLSTTSSNDTSVAFTVLVASGAHWSGACASYGVGGGLNGTEMTALYNAEHAFMQAVAGVT